MVLYLADFAELAAAQGHVPRSARLYGASLALQDRTGVQLADVWRKGNTPYALEGRKLLETMDHAQREALLAEGAALSSDAAIAYALTDPARGS